jgi:hypothetical protein
MSYQGIRARAADDESTRLFEVSKVRRGADGRVIDVLWAEVDARTGHDVGARVIVPVADVIDAMHDGARVAAVFPQRAGQRPERFFVVTQQAEGVERISLDGEPSPGRELSDIGTLDAPAGAEAPAAALPAAAPLGANAGRRHARTFAVSRVELDPDGRVVAVQWGPVDTVANAWAGDEVVAPVAAVVQALRLGDAVFALFPSAHGHVPERRFVAVDYDDGRQTIVLDGPSTHAREIHDMDRLDTTAHLRRPAPSAPSAGIRA